MKNVGFLISKKENERRRAIVYEDLKKIRNKECIYFEEGYGELLGFSDELLRSQGFKVERFDQIIDKCEIICDPKIGDAEYLKNIKNKTIFGWIHATQNYDIAQTMIDNKLTGYAWEKMYDDTRHIFYKNNELAGEAAILHAMINFGRSFNNLDVAVIGNGNTAKGAIKILNQIGANITIYTKDNERLLREEFIKYDVIVNCVLWDVERKDHLINKKDLKRMKKNSLIVDISCDKCGGIETSIPTTIENPIYNVCGITHYAVDHTPSLFYKNSSEAISNAVVKYVDLLVEEKENDVLNNCLIIRDGIVLDDEINKYQNR